MAHLDHTATVVPRLALIGSGDELLIITARTEPSGAAVVAVRGEMETTTCPLLRDRLIAHLRFTHQLVLDLGEVTFLGAVGLTLLVQVRAAALMAGTRLCVVARTRPVLLPVMITGLTGALDLHADVADALLCLALPAGPRLVDPRQAGDLR